MGGEISLIPHQTGEIMYTKPIYEEIGKGSNFLKLLAIQ